MEGLELHRDEVNTGHDSRMVPRDFDVPGRLKRWRIPAVAEAQDALVGRHYVDDEVAMFPAADWRALPVIFG